MTDTPSLAAAHTTALPGLEDSSHACIAKAVVALLTHTISATLDRALTQCIDQLHKELGAQSQCI